jgi:GrpB-like predicted nucleotidyltransferase (UPF0157 family)
MNSQPVQIHLADYDPRWPGLFRSEAERIRKALGNRALAIDHAGSTSVPGLPAKPIIDIILTVQDSRLECDYVPPLESLGYVVWVREPNWHEHRMLRLENEVNLHVFSGRCPEIDRMLLFRDWLRNNPVDRDLYARAKLALTEKGWNEVQEYADAKTEIINEIIARAGLHGNE